MLDCIWNTHAETRFHLLAKWTSPFKSVGASVHSTTGSQGVRISNGNVGYTMFWGSVKATVYPLHLPASPSFPLPCRLLFEQSIAIPVYKNVIWNQGDRLQDKGIKCNLLQEYNEYNVKKKLLSLLTVQHICNMANADMQNLWLTFLNVLKNPVHCLQCSVPLLTILLKVKKNQSCNFTYTTFTNSTKSSSDRMFFTHACSLDGKGLLNSEVHELAFSQLYPAL